MSVIEIPWNPTQRQLRQFAQLLTIFSVAFAGWLFYRDAAPPWLIIVVSVGILLGGLGIVWPRLLRWIYVGWMVTVFPIGWLISHALLGLIFYALITPVGLLMRCCKYDPMQRRWDRTAKTYWQARPKNDDAERYFKQY